MLELKSNSLNSAARTPHETHEKILAYLDAGGFEEDSRARVFSDGIRTIIVFYNAPSGEYRYTEVVQRDASFGVDDIEQSNSMNSSAQKSQLNCKANMTFDEAKNKIISMLKNPTTKTITIVGMGAGKDADIAALGKQLRADSEIEQALLESGYIGHLDYGHNRYAQGPISLKFRITESKRGKSGWSEW